VNNRERQTVDSRMQESARRPLTLFMDEEQQTPQLSGCGVSVCRSANLCQSNSCGSAAIACQIVVSQLTPAARQFVCYSSCHGPHLP